MAGDLGDNLSETDDLSEEVVTGFPDLADSVASLTRPASRERFSLSVAAMISLVLHLAAGVGVYAVIHQHVWKDPKFSLVRGDQGGDGTSGEIVAGDAEARPATGGDAPMPIPPLASEPLNQPPVELQPPEKTLPADENLPKAPHDLARMDLIAIPDGWIGVSPSALQDAPVFSPSRLPTAFQGAAGSPATTQPVMASGAGDGTLASMKPPRAAARGSGYGKSSGRRGSEEGYDERGLPIPEYPAESRRRGEQGLVEVDVEVLADGRVGSAEVCTDSGYPRLNEAALAAARKGLFEPATLDDKPVATHIVIPYRFVLK